MAKEIERKFLVDTSHPDFQNLLESQPENIRQGYLKSDENGVVRVRISDTRAFLTVKGPTRGITRDEFEYEIPLKDGEEMLASICQSELHKKRYRLDLGNSLTFEVDIFSQIDLVLAEIELPDENTDFPRPAWLGRDVSDNPAYFNNAIAERISNTASDKAVLDQVMATPWCLLAPRQHLVLLGMLAALTLGALAGAGIPW